MKIKRIENILVWILLFAIISISAYNYFSIVPEANRQIQKRKIELKEGIKNGIYKITTKTVGPIEVTYDPRNTKFINLGYVGCGIGLLGFSVGVGILCKNKINKRRRR